MDKIVSIEEIGEKISEIRNLRKGFVTNFYLEIFKHSIWIKNESLFSYKCGNTLFFIKNNSEFWNVFYCSTNLADLEQDIPQFKSKYDDHVLMFDIVGNADQSKQMKSLFNKLIFYNYCSLVRMSRKTAVIEYDSLFNYVCYATKEQVPEVFDLLNCYFDKKTEQIPYLEELISYAELNHILIYKKDDKIIGFVIFEKNKSTQYLRYWFVHPDYRDLKIGSALFKRFFYEGRDTNRQLFWVIQSNENAIKRYKHYGFVEENLFDNVFTNKNIQYERTNN